MSKDVVVVVTLESVDHSSDSLDILLISTAGVKAAKTYTTLEDIETDWKKDSVIYKQAAALMGQGKAKPAPESLIQKVKVVGLAKPDTPEAFVTAIKEYQEIDNDWYMFLTDQIEDQDRQKCQQVRGKCQVIVRSKLCLEIELCQRQGILSCPGHDDKRCHYVVPYGKSCDNRNRRMHRFHNGKYHFPVCSPCTCAVHPRRLFQRNRNISEISGIQ